MNKAWIYILAVLGFFVVYRQIVFSGQPTHSPLLAEHRSTSCNIDTYFHYPNRLEDCCMRPSPDPACNACKPYPVPTQCYPWITLTPGALDETLACPIPTPQEQCPSTCHTDTVTVPDGKCGTTVCQPNAPIAVTCPTTCSSAFSGPDGNCGTIDCACVDGPPQKPVVVAVGTNGASSSLPIAVNIDWTFGNGLLGCGNEWGLSCTSQQNEFIIKIDGLSNGSRKQEYVRRTTVSVTSWGTHTATVCASNGFSTSCSSEKSFTVLMPTPTPINVGFVSPSYTEGGIVISVSSLLPTPLPTARPTAHPPTPTSTPRPTSLPTATPSRPYYYPTPTTPPYVPPTAIPPTPLPTIPIPTPTLPILPSSLTSQKTTTESKTTYILDTKNLNEIKIAANALPSANTPTERPLLPQEQQLLAKNEPLANTGGILVTLQQKIGDAFVTRQDELTVKRGNQFFTIKNQTGLTDQVEVKTNKSNQAKKEALVEENTAPLPRLEINANNVVAQSTMGLSVDPLSGILTVETPSGPKRVSIMPDEALGIVVELRALSMNNKTVDPSILLVSEKGALIYRISGERVEKFLGLFPFPIQKQILVSADTGSVIKIELTLLAQILSLFTF